MRTTYRVLTSGGSRRAYARGISPSLHAPAAAALPVALLMLLAAGGLRGARAAESSRVEEAGGRIQVQSAPGEGTTVTISLPAETPD